MAIFFVRERYREGTGLLYRADARIKIALAVLFAFAVTVIPDGHWPAFGGFALFVVAAIALSRVPPHLVVARSMIALPFVAVAVPLAFTRGGDTLFTVPALGWTASDAGVIAVSSIMLKSWLAVLVAVVLTSVTRPVDLIRGLERLRVPRTLAATVMFMYRYLFVIGEEGHRLMRARDARSADAGRPGSGGSVWWRGRVLGAMVGSLFLRSLERSERVYAAMQARGYDGTIRLTSERALAARDWLLLAAAATALAALVTYARI